MRMNALTMQAFGPFPTRQQVDFDALGADGLFLIAGPTGAGKTTILDALSFGLYGTVPGARSDAEDYRSHYADDGTPTYVEVEFTAHDRRWRVRRSPRYLRPKKRGEGMTEARPTAELSVFDPETGQWDGRGRTTSEVQPEINELLGLNAAQFMQIVLLPQGEFARFLRSDPVEREPILRRLFATEHFTAVERILEQRAKDARAALEAAAHERHARMRQAVDLCDEDIELPTDAYPSAAAFDAVLGTVETVLAEQVGVFDELLTGAQDRSRDADRVAEAAERRLTEHIQLEQLRARQADYAAGAAQRARWRVQREQAQRAAAVLPYQREAHRAAADADAAQTALTTAEAELQAVREALPGVPGDDDIEALGRAAGAAQRSAAAVRAHLLRRTQLTDEQSKLERESAETQNLLQGLTDRSARLGGEQTDVDSRLEARSAIDSDEVQVSRALAAGQQRDALTAEIDRARRRESSLRTALADAQDAETAARQHFTTVRAARLAGIAAELAAELDDDQPCSVCGSLEHPQPARPQEDATSRADEEAALQAWTAAQERVNSQRSLLAECSAEIAARSAARVQAQTEAGDTPVTVLQAAAAALAEAQETLDALRRRREQLKAELSALEREREGARNEAQRITSQRAAVEAQLAQLDDVVSSEHRAALARVGLSVPTTVDDAEEQEAVLEQLQQAAEATAQALAAHAQCRDEQQQRLSAFHSALEQEGFTTDVGQDDAASGLGMVVGAGQGQDDAASGLGMDTATSLGQDPSAGPDPEPGDRLAQAEHRFTTAARIDQEAVEAALRREADTAARLEELTSQDWYRRATAEQATEHQLQQARDRAKERADAAAADLDHAGQRLAVHRQRAADLAELRERCRTEAAAIEEDIAQHRGDVALDGIVRATSPENLRRLPLSAYALLSLFVEVAHNASERLQTMSGGRFTLVHDLALHRRERRAGLGLQVIDTFTEEPRDPRSLSGGETFMASLALALGLADTVSAAAGGIRLESLFIDEGFGSLDPDTLAQVLEVLDELRSGGRCVGVISHVQSMLQSIPLQLRIERSPTGSTIRQLTAGSADRHEDPHEDR